MRFLALFRTATLAAAAFCAAVLAAPTTSANDSAGIDAAGMDLSVKPGDDFFAYANGGWIKATTIPPDQSSWGPIDVLVEQTVQRVRIIIQETSARKSAAGSEARKIGDYYSSYLDTAAIDAKGLQPIRPELTKIAALQDRTALARALGETLRADVDPLNNTNFHTDHLFGLWIAQDFDNPLRNTAYLLQGGLGLPDRQYYSDAPDMLAIQRPYGAHISKILSLAGLPDPEAQAARILALEAKIARVHATGVESRDLVKAHNPWSRADFARNAPGIDWDAYFGGAQLRADRFIVWQPAAFRGEAALVASEPLADWKAYLTFHALDDASPVLPKAFIDEHFDFHEHILEGVPQQPSRWKNAVHATNAALGDAVGKLYVQRHFAGAAKPKIEALVRNLIAAFGRRIDALVWMSPSTKHEAKAKLKTLRVGVGYPDRWRSYDALGVIPGDAYGNWRRAGLFRYQYALDKLAAAVDRDEWWLAPQTVNSLNLPVQNALNFPAAILQPPFFDPAAPDAANYGAIGSLIGHEISHSFDNQGASFDAAGKLRNWWTADDFAHFTSSAERLVRQYDAYRPFPELHVNGALTSTENIADAAGLSAAHLAWRLSLGQQGASPQQGFSGDQQFFIAFAQGWRETAREADLRRQVHTNEHAPSEYRADTVRNVDAWYAAFDVKPDQKLYLAPDKRIPIW